MFRLIEPIHAVTYFHPAARAAHEDAGVRGFWRGYFAMRAAPFGPVGPETVTAAFFNFHPSTVARALPAVWDLISPASALEVRLGGARAALEHALGPPSPDVAAAGDQLDGIARDLPVDGRVLFAANTAIDTPSDAWGRLFHATTMLREHRGDGHSSAWVAHGLHGIDAHRLRIALDGFDADTLLAGRGWSEDDVAGCEHRLRSRGLLAGDGTLTTDGRALVDDVETATDRAAAAATDRLGDDGLERIDAALRPLVDRLADDVIPFPNAVGVDRA
ncbi:MAG: hypothetical protein AAGD33_19775 [Actinomycetota bacterium]